MDADTVSFHMVDVLLHWGASPDIPDLKGDSPRDYAWNRDYVPMRIRELVIGTPAGRPVIHPPVVDLTQEDDDLSEDSLDYDNVGHSSEDGSHSD